MSSVQKALFPGVLAGIFAVVMLTSLIASPRPALASNGADDPRPAEQSAPEIAVEPVSQASAAPEQPAADDSCSLPRAYPESIRRWCNLIESAAGQYGLEAALVAAVMLQESGGDPQAYSSSGAVGLLQVMPRDGLAASFLCANGPCFRSRPSMDELFDPAFNVDYGARMLAGLVERLGGMRDALAAYGPANVGYYYADKVLAIYENMR